MAGGARLSAGPPPDAPASGGGPVGRGLLLGGIVAVSAAAAAVLPTGTPADPRWHLVVEAASVVLAGLLGCLALIRFYARRHRIFLFIGTGFLVAAVLDAVHALVATDLLTGPAGPASADVSAWSWLQSRVFLSLFLVVSAFSDTGDDGGVGETRVFVRAAALAGIVLLAFGVIPPPRAIDPSGPISRPGELLPATLFGVAALGYLVRRRWTTDVFEFWLLVALLIAGVGHLGFMARSVQLHDPAYQAAHLLKLGSYAAVVCGLLIGLYETFRRESEALRIGAAANQALAREVEVRREAESVLQRSEERLQGFLDSAHDLIQSTGPDGRILYVNRAWERTLGYDRTEMEGAQLATLLHPRCRRRVLRQFRRVLEGDAVDEILAEFISKDGRTVVCSGRATRHVADGEAVATQSIFRDITGQRAVERELAASRANVQALVENTGDMIWSIDTRHRLVTFNSAFALATEARWGREPQVGDAPGTVFGADAAPWYEELYARVLRGQRFSALREESVAGQTRAYEIFCNPVHEGAGSTGAVMFGRDVTRRLQAEEALRIAKEEAEAANRAKSQFLANMSHELRTPLNSVIGFANILLKNKRGNLEEKDLGFLDRILANGRHLLALINEVLDLAKIEAGRMELDLETTDLTALIRETVAQLEGQAREKDVVLRAELPPHAPPPVETDPSKLKQILINLVGNALKFSEGGTVTVRLEVTPGGRASGIAVADTGIGIPGPRLQAIFEAFAQADQSTSRRFGGTGLGLTISRSLCQLLGYEMEVASTVGEGSTFTIRIAEARRAGPPEPPSAQARAAFAAKSSNSEGAPGIRDRRILVVDDEEDARHVLSHHLRDLGCTVVTAASGQEALDRAVREPPDLITLDLAMPDLDGAEVLRRLEANPATREIPVVVVSVTGREARGSLLGAVEILAKPVDRDDLLRVVWRTLVRPGAARVLVIQDPAQADAGVAGALEAAGLEVRRWAGGGDPTAALDEDAPDAVVLDRCGDPTATAALLATVRSDPHHGGLPVVVLIDEDPGGSAGETLRDSATALLRAGPGDGMPETELLRTLGSFLPLGALPTP